MRTRRSQSSGNPMSPSPGHRSVLLHEVVEALSLAADDVVVDATLGGAGHALAIAKHLGPRGVLIGVDADHDALVRARDVLAEALPAGRHGAPTAVLINANFRAIRTDLESRGITRITKAVFDLGWSSFQLQAGRGFSFLADEPLAMTYAQPPTEGHTLTARTIVNEWSGESIADVLFGWGEERYSRRIARAIVEAREKKPIETSRELGELIKSAVPRAYANGRLHPATKTFQALRIAVNDELGALKEGLQATWDVLAPHGRIAVISFHSIEDRIVKEMFLQWDRTGDGVRITRKPIVPSDLELAENPRARSAKLRVIEKHPDQQFKQ